MKLIAISSNITGKALENALIDVDAVVIDPGFVKSIEELQLAEHLAKKSFSSKKNIAKKLKYEFLLFLSGKTELKSAFRLVNPKGSEMILAVFSGNEDEILKKLNATKQKLKLKENADSLDIERISLSRIKN